MPGGRARECRRRGLLVTGQKGGGYEAGLKKRRGVDARVNCLFFFGIFPAGARLRAAGAEGFAEPGLRGIGDAEGRARIGLFDRTSEGGSDPEQALLR